MAFAGKSYNRYINMCIISLDILMIIPFRELNCVYQFHGCYFHGCPICKPNNCDDKIKGKSLNEKFIKTKEIKECGSRNYLGM